MPTGGDWHRFELIDTPENIEAVDMAIRLISGEEAAPAVDDEVVLALRKGQSYVESLLARQSVVTESKVALDPDSQNEIDDLLLRGAT